MLMRNKHREKRFGILIFAGFDLSSGPNVKSRHRQNLFLHSSNLRRYDPTGCAWAPEMASLLRLSIRTRSKRFSPPDGKAIRYIHLNTYPRAMVDGSLRIHHPTFMVSKPLVRFAIESETSTVSEVGFFVVSGATVISFAHLFSSSLRVIIVSDYKLTR